MPLSFYIISDLDHQLHLTLVPAFKIREKDRQLVEELLENTSAVYPSMKAKINKVDYFTGKQHSRLKVSKVESTDLIHMHNELWKGIKKIGGISERPNFIEHNYVPHITYNETMNEGSELEISSFRLSQFDRVQEVEIYSSKNFSFAGAH